VCVCVCVIVIGSTGGNDVDKHNLQPLQW